MNRISLQFTQMFYNLSLPLECCNLYFSCRFTKKPQNENSLQVPEGNKGEEWTKPCSVITFLEFINFQFAKLAYFLDKKLSWKIHWNISTLIWFSEQISLCTYKKPTLDLLAGISTNIWTPNTGREAFDSEETKEFFRTCNILPFSCTHLALWGKVKDPRYMQNKKDSRISLEETPYVFDTEFSRFIKNIGNTPTDDFRVKFFQVSIFSFSNFLA